MTYHLEVCGYVFPLVYHSFYWCIMLLLPHRSILGLAKLASRTTMRFSNVLVTRIPFYNRRCRLLSTAVGASLAGRHKVRMPVRLGENETGGDASDEGREEDDRSP